MLTHNVAVTGAQLLYPGVSLGTTFRYVRASVGLAPGDPVLPTSDLRRQTEDLVTRAENKVDFDLGLMLGSETVRVGVVARNLLQPTLGTPVLALTPGMYLDGQVTRGRESVERGWGIAGRVGF